VARQRTVSKQLREAILAAPITRYRIAKDTGITQGALSRFVRGERGLDLTSIDKLATYLDLTLVTRPTKSKGR
jgi:transcriptional regulator with XRE-family HTH domain